jgi:hypothetical protein
VLYAYKEECFPIYGAPKNKKDVTYNKYKVGQRCAVYLKPEERNTIGHYLMQIKRLTNNKYTRTSIVDDGLIDILLTRVRRDNKPDEDFYITLKKVLHDFKGKFVDMLFTELGISGNI